MYNNRFNHNGSVYRALNVNEENDAQAAKILMDHGFEPRYYNALGNDGMLSVFLRDRVVVGADKFIPYREGIHGHRA